MSFYNNKKPQVEYYWRLSVDTLRAIAKDIKESSVNKRLATGIANQKDGLRRAPSIKENRAKALNYIIFALKGQAGTLGGMGYRFNTRNTDLTSEEYQSIQAAIKNARDAVTAALHCVERVSKAKSKKQKNQQENDDALHSNL